MPEQRVLNVSAGTPLSGVTIAVTRPTEQAHGLKGLLNDVGARVVSFPTLEIVSCMDAVPTQHWQSLGTADWVVFVSTNAVQYALPAARAHNAWPAKASIAAVGGSTAAALAAFDITSVVTPEVGSGAQALLAIPEFSDDAIRGQIVVIAKGRGGLAVLQQTLESRGARVVELEVYERRRPQVIANDFVTAGIHGEIDIVVAASAQSLENLIDMVGARGRDWILSAPLVVVSERIADAAVELGMKRRPMVASGARDDQIVEALILLRDRI